MNSRRYALIVGIVLALGTVALLMNVLASAHNGDGQPRTVVVANQDIPARIKIDPSMLRVTQATSNDVDSDALSDPHVASGMISLITIPNGATITQSKLGKADALAIPRRLAAGLRAVSISIDRVKGVAGLVTPGDRVDVIAVPPRVGNETPRATAIIRGALVLAMGAETEVARATPAPDQNLTTVTLAVTPQQADLIALADVNTTLRLALRPPEESIRAFPTEELQLGIQPQIETSPTQEPTSGRQSTMMAQSAVVVQHNPTPAPMVAHNDIEVIEGDRFVNLSSQRP